MNWYKKSKRVLTYLGNCKNTIPSTFSDANDMMQVVKQDDMSYDDSSFFHDPSIQIPEQEFEMLIESPIQPVLKSLKITGSYFIGKNQGFLFIYDNNKDIHHFWG